MKRWYINVMDDLMNKLEDRRDKIIEQLSEKYSQNLFSLEEYERLIEYGNKIKTDKELTLFTKIIEANNVVDDENRNSDSFKKIRSLKKGVATIIGDIKIEISEEDFKNSSEIIIKMFSLIGDITIYIDDGIEVNNKVIHVIGDVDIKLNTEIRNSRNKKVILKGMNFIGDIKIIKK
jgi:hypothetical protein